MPPKLDKLLPNKKKARSTNFDNEEVAIVLKLIDEEKSVLMNKETNKITNALKELAWERIVAKFNASTARKIPRTKDSLVGLWRKTKTEARTDKSNRKRNLFATGGGPSSWLPVDAEKQSLMEEALTILGDTVKPLQSTADSDTTFHDTSTNIMRAYVSNTDFERDNEVNKSSTDKSHSNEELYEMVIDENGLSIPLLSEYEVLPTQSGGVDDILLEAPQFAVGSKRRRPVLKSTYEKLNKISDQKLDQLSRAENNEHELLGIKKKRLKLEEDLTIKHCQLIEANIQYINDKNQRESDIHLKQLELLEAQINKHF